MSTETPPTESPVELEAWFTEMKFQNSTTISEALSSCYGVLSNTWDSKSGDYRLISEAKFRTSIASCKSFVSLALNNQLSSCRDEGEYWYRINLATGTTSTVLFVLLTILLTRLRRSNRIRSKLKGCSQNVMKKGSLFPWMKKSSSTTKADSTTTPVYQPLLKPSPSASALSTSTFQEGAYNYILESPYSAGTIGTAQLNPIFIQRAQAGPTPCSGSSRKQDNMSSELPAAVLGIPPSPYPRQMPRGMLTSPASVIPTPAGREHAELKQAETVNGQQGQILQEHDPDRNVFYVVENIITTE